MHLTLSVGARALAILSLIAATYLLGPIVPFIVALGLTAVATSRMAMKPRKPWMHAGLPIALMFALAPTLAFAASIDIGQALNGSLQEIINAAVTGLIAVMVGWVAVVFKNKFNIDIEARHREALTAFLQRQASGLVAAGAVKLEGVKVEVKNEALAAAANTALAAIPGALAFFGLTPAKIQSMIVDMLPKQPAVAQAQAVAIDVANPATPSTPAA
jgi:hypothetical protein